MDSIYPFLVIIYANSRKKIKKLNKRIKDQKNKQEIKKCLVLRRIKGRKQLGDSKWIGTEYEIIDIDEVGQVSRRTNKQQEKPN